MDEMQLVQDAVSDAYAFAEFYHLYVTCVYRYHMIHIGNVKDAEEFTSQTFMVALEELRTFHGTGSLAAWIMGIATQKRSQDSRSNRRALSTDAVLYYQRSGLSTNKTTVQRMEIETISHALKQISPDCAEAITLYFFGNLTSSEVSQVLKKSPTSIEMLIGRGIQELRTRTSLSAGQKDQRSIDRTAEEDALVEKLARIASQIALDPLFISELEQTLVAHHQPKTKRMLPLQLQQFASVAGWVALIAIGIFMLNWRVIPNSPPAVQGTQTSSQTPLATKTKSSAVAPSLITKTAKPTATRFPTLEYIVQAGDNCTYIAERYGVTIDQLITFNHLNSSCDIWVDQKLVIPILGTATPQ